MSFGKLRYTNIFIAAISILIGCTPKKMVTVTTTPPKAALTIDGKDKGTTPYTAKLIFEDNKTFKIVARKKGYTEGRTTINLEPLDNTDYHIHLKQIHKMVNITTTPAGADIYINGQKIGTSPIENQYLLFKNNIQFEIVAKKEPWYVEGKKLIYLKPFDETNYHIRLKKSKTVPIDLISFEPQLAEEGVKLTLTVKPTLAYIDVTERSTNIKSVMRITRNDDMVASIGSPVMSPTEDAMFYRVYEKEKNGREHSNIWKQDVNSPSKTRLTYGKWLDTFPTFTQDGKYLVFSSNRTSLNPTLWRIKVGDVGGMTRLTNTLAEDYSPSVSPNGDVIAYVSNIPRAEEPQIWSISLSGGLPTQLREGETPQVSPDGKRVLFVRKNSDTKKSQMWLMDLNGSNETQLTQNIEHNVIHPKWSPDGKWLIYSSDEGVDPNNIRNYDIWMMKLDGSQKTQLTTNGSRDDSPAWDREGKYVYFRSNRGVAWNIWRFEPNQAQSLW